MPLQLQALRKHTINKTARVYTNPATDNISIEVPYDNNCEVTIFNIQGTKIGTAKIEANNNYTFDVTKLVPGIYTVQVVSGSNKEVLKFTKL